VQVVPHCSTSPPQAVQRSKRVIRREHHLQQLQMSGFTPRIKQLHLGQLAIVRNGPHLKPMFKKITQRID
tara:strand:- start:109 stop:318 length:210 start_codon:yes stop_codon:yes gene_type:complete